MAVVVITKTMAVTPDGYKAEGYQIGKTWEDDILGKLMGEHQSKAFAWTMSYTDLIFFPPEHMTLRKRSVINVLRAQLGFPPA